MPYNRIALFERIIRNSQYDDFLAFAQYMWITKRCSLFNSAMILLQRPGAQFVENEDNWYRKYKRSIKAEATPIVVLKPFGPVDFLYDLADTYGEDMPDYMRSSFVKPPMKPLDKYDFSSFTNAVNSMGISYGEQQLGSRQGGFAEYLSQPILLTKCKEKEKRQVATHYAIVVNQNLSESQKASVILHEIGHILCGHIGQDRDNKDITVPDRRNENPTNSVMEFEAEKVCEIVSELLCIDSNSKSYLRKFTANGSEPQYSFRIVIEAADKVIKCFNTCLSMHGMQLSLFDF